MIGIYKITSPSNRIYIGQSIDVENRFKEYKRKKCKGQIRLYNSLSKYGFENHKFEILEECEISQLNERERYYQELYDVLSTKGLNCNYTKTSDKSGRFSQEVIDKRSLTKYGRLPLPKKEKTIGKRCLKGVNNPFYGKKHTEETKNILREKNSGYNNPMFGIKGSLHFNYGRKHDLTNRIFKIGKDHHNYGRKFSEDFCEKISKSKKGTQLLSNNPNAKKVINKETKQIYNSLKELSLEIKIEYDTIRARMKKDNYIYCYLDNYKIVED